MTEQRAVNGHYIFTWWLFSQRPRCGINKRNTAMRVLCFAVHSTTTKKLFETAKIFTHHGFHGFD
jgi:hypothetical protein